MIPRTTNTGVTCNVESLSLGGSVRGEPEAWKDCLRRICRRRIRPRSLLKPPSINTCANTYLSSDRQISCKTWYLSQWQGTVPKVIYQAVGLSYSAQCPTDFQTQSGLTWGDSPDRAIGGRRRDRGCSYPPFIARSQSASWISGSATVCKPYLHARSFTSSREGNRLCWRSSLIKGATIRLKAPRWVLGWESQTRSRVRPSFWYLRVRVEIRKASRSRWRDSANVPYPIVLSSPNRPSFLSGCRPTNKLLTSTLNYQNQLNQEHLGKALQ